VASKNAALGVLRTLVVEVVTARPPSTQCSFKLPLVEYHRYDRRSIMDHYETSQLPLFRLLGPPADGKELASFEGGHIFLGPVAT
jgi:hypothetical protein